MTLSTEQRSTICLAAGCQKIIDETPMQSLWAGKGELTRLTLTGLAESNQPVHSLVVKQIAYNANGEHPRGWNTQQSQLRKRRSYQVEMAWYQRFAPLVNQAARVPHLVYSESSESGLLLVLEDLAITYPDRFTAGKDDRPTTRQIQSCVRWLAKLHARTLNLDIEEMSHHQVQQNRATHSPNALDESLPNHPSDLWPIGGYWHLDTRPDEWQSMTDGKLKQAAQALDNELRNCRFQSLIHGDAKLANFCFANPALDGCGEQVAAVDFQYVGQGPGVKDLMLLLSSVMPDQGLVTHAPGFVDDYFEQLVVELNRWQPAIGAEQVVSAWRPLYAVAWADFHRFLAGWSPGHWKIGDYCQQQTELALSALPPQRDHKVD
ncbi:ecdysteroid 22-kinase family protein [Neiella marina]|uniref:Ecdysteroid 22-kinase family protein n=1 Tax=Neiella holothuriorum TaxID=2870530 RepID=A0ABS7EKC4_9GAMM|nr:phosphotransferase [Neiella holothuriorum]MBW8192807.1 ecdysteroid 22-kinase family protein [Neiella holothuriorum]